MAGRGEPPRHPEALSPLSGEGVPGGAPWLLPRRGAEPTQDRLRVTLGDPEPSYKGRWRMWVAPKLRKTQECGGLVLASGLVVPWVSLFSFLGRDHTKRPFMAGQVSGRSPQSLPFH